MQGEMVRWKDLGHENADQFLLRIDPEARAIETAPGVSTDRGRLVLAGSGHNAEAVTEAVGWRHEFEVTDLVAGHLPNRFRLQDTNAVPLAAIQEHLQKAGVIRGACSETRAARTVAAAPGTGR